MKWSNVLARLPLPMLALAAAYGVFEFQLRFVPWWVAFISAAAFEVTYIALAFVATPDPRRATAISIAAVVVSVAYNTLAALFTRRPALLDAPPLWGDVALALLHGLPLAVVAYNVSALLLHAARSVERDEAPALHMTQAVQVNVLAEHSATPPALPSPSKTARVKQLAAEHGKSETTIWRWVNEGKVEL